MTFLFEFLGPVWMDGWGVWPQPSDSGCALWYIALPSPSPIPRHRYAPHSIQLGLLKVLSTWLPRKALGNSHDWLPESPATGTSCDCTYTRGVQMSLLVLHVLCLCPKELFLSQPRIQRFKAGLAVLRLLMLVSQGLFLRPAESPEFLELTKQLRDKRLCGARAVLENSLQLGLLLLYG